uniref:Uncharacterized protein n=1 Tax=Pseudo-nitzschia delicatissima TaxID=44447 RepID=A0A7S0UI35_9STRA|mmetsp:Transcript_706/g.1450  ORF Transcript_706/g.1450 Transcript_706/m.1450 type:complete len:193 (+) Transcript_706:87-665(+)
MKTAILASIVASAAAFAPAQQGSRSSALAEKNQAFAGEIGVVAPLGLYDPFNLLDNADQDRFDHLRAVELKHGRISMLAVVGYLVTYAGVRLPGLEDVPSGFAAWDALPKEVAGQMGMALVLMEMANRDNSGTAEFVGDFRNGALDFGWDEQTDAWKTKKRTIEINNGRAAMMGILGLMVHEGMGDVGMILP